MEAIRQPQYWESIQSNIWTWLIPPSQLAWKGCATSHWKLQLEKTRLVAPLKIQQFNVNTYILSSWKRGRIHFNIIMWHSGRSLRVSEILQHEQGHQKFSRLSLKYDIIQSSNELKSGVDISLYKQIHTLLLQKLVRCWQSFSRLHAQNWWSHTGFRLTTVPNWAEIFGKVENLFENRCSLAVSIWGTNIDQC